MRGTTKHENQKDLRRFCIPIVPLPEHRFFCLADFSVFRACGSSSVHRVRSNFARPRNASNLAWQLPKMKCIWIVSVAVSDQVKSRCWALVQPARSTDPVYLFLDPREHEVAARCWIIANNNLDTFESNRGQRNCLPFRKIFSGNHEMAQTPE